MNSAGTNDDLLPLMSSTSYQRNKLSVLFLLSVRSFTPAIVVLLVQMLAIVIIIDLWHVIHVRISELTLTLVTLS